MPNITRSADRTRSANTPFAMRPVRFEPFNRDVPRRAVMSDSYLITYEALDRAVEGDPAFDGLLSPGARRELMHQSQSNPRVTIPELERLLERVPTSRVLLNWLASAYSGTGRLDESRRIAIRNFELHPDYLFARLNYISLLLHEGKLDEVGRIMQDKWDLKLLFPQRSVFHCVEFLALGHTAVEFFARSGKMDEARVMLERMRRVHPEHQATRLAEQTIQIQESIQRFEQSRSLLIEARKKQCADGWGWRWEGLEAWSTEAIFAQLRELGIEMDVERFRERAAALLRFKPLQDEWVEQFPPDKRNAGFWEDFPLMAVHVLWERLAADVVCADLIENRLYETIRAEDDGTPLPEVDGMPAFVAAALGLARFLRSLAPAERAAQYEQIVDGEFQSYLEPLLDLIETHAGEFPDVVLEIAESLADCGDATDYLPRLAEALAAAGRNNEAMARAQANIAQFPDDVWVRILAGDVVLRLGDDAQALQIWTDALDLAGDGNDWDAAADRICEMFDEAERPDGLDLDELFDAHPCPADAPEPMLEPELLPLPELPEPEPEPVPQLARARTVGRNDPCPCGSGKKYKKCCLR